MFASIHCSATNFTCQSIPTSPDVIVTIQYCTAESGLTSIHVCLFTMFCVFISSVASFHQRMTKPCTTIHICICIPTYSLKLVLAFGQIIISKRPSLNSLNTLLKSCRSLVWVQALGVTRHRLQQQLQVFNFSGRHSVSWLRWRPENSLYTLH